MRFLANAFDGLWARLDLPPNARRTFRFHVAYAVFDAVAGGVLLNAPLVALRALGSPNWQLPMREAYSGVGMIAALYLGSWMATRRKMPFVLIPGTCAGLASLAMTLVVGNAFWFLTFFSLGALLEILTRPAVTAILRLNYPVAQRAHATGRVRQWSSLAFVASNLAAAALLQWADQRAILMAQAQMLAAALVGLAGILCFRQIRVPDDVRSRGDHRLAILPNLLASVDVVVRDARFRRYLFGCFLDGFCQMLYWPLLWALFTKTLDYGFFGAAAMMHSLPALVAFATTGCIGWWIDRTNPWVAWAWIRFAWALDALLLATTPFLAGYLPPVVLILPLAGRLVRGAVQGGWWILWWQIGVTHFAPPGENTSRYMGLMTFLNGATRLLASAMGMVLASLQVEPVTLIAFGGTGVLLSGVYSLAQAARDRREQCPPTPSAFEAQFSHDLV